jgi:hypothetical protein
MGSSWTPDIDRDRLATERMRACETFLATRGTALPRLAAVIGGQFKGITHLLLTSSPVHGLANATSDIDTICVVEGESLPERTATQIFDAGNHYETIPFTATEVAGELARLQEAAALPGPAAVVAFRNWDKGGPISRKYLERFVNGVGTDGASPYLEKLGDLATLWRAASLARALTMTECARLSIAAGENRGASGYVLNALLYAMDAFLSHHGRVYSNKKWYALRLHRFLADETVPELSRARGEALLGLWQQAEAALRDDDTAGPLVAALTPLMGVTEAFIALPLSANAHWTPAEASAPLDFLPGAKIQFARGMLHYAGAANAGPFQQEGEQIAPAAARHRLHAARAGLLTPAFAPGSAANG